MPHNGVPHEVTGTCQDTEHFSVCQNVADNFFSTKWETVLEPTQRDNGGRNVLTSGQFQYYKLRGPSCAL
jgi:hypothetical protein